MARPKLGGESERLNMVISSKELQAIEDWRFKNRVQSKSEAIRRLCQIGLAYDAQAAEWQRLVDEAFQHAGAIGREALEVDDEETADYRMLHLRSLAHLVLFSKSAGELVRQMSEQARYTSALKSEADIDAVIQKHTGLRAAIETAESALTEEDPST